tara:strand:- start:490 stop:1695 length:1206 start_codon:yes stop_codon:yes gene_type:complete
MRLASSFALATIGSIGFWGVVLILPEVQTEFGVNRGDASISYTVTMIGFALGNVLFGRYVDRLGVVIPVIIASIAMAIGHIGSSLATNIWIFAFFQGVFIGLGTAASFGPLIADVSHWFRRRRGVAVSLCACGNYIGGAIWPLILTNVIEEFGWRSTYIIIAIVISLTKIPIALTLRKPSPKEVSCVTEHAPASSKGTSRNLCSLVLTPSRLLFLLSVAGFSCCVAMSMPQVHIVAYCSDLGFGVARGAEMLSLMLVGGAITRILSGFLADRIGGVKTLLIGSFLQGVALMFYLPFDGLVSLYVISAMFGIAQGGIVPCYAIIVREHMSAKIAAERVGFLIMMTIFGMGFGGWSSGWIYDISGSYQAAFLHGIGWNVVNFGIVMLLLFRLDDGHPKKLVGA